MNTKMKSLLALLLALLVMAPALAEPVAETDAAPAEPYVELSTHYPAMTVNAGDEMTLDLAIDNYRANHRTSSSAFWRCRKAGRAISAPAGSA